MNSWYADSFYCRVNNQDLYLQPLMVYDLSIPRSGANRGCTWSRAARRSHSHGRSCSNISLLSSALCCGEERLSSQGWNYSSPLTAASLFTLFSPCKKPKWRGQWSQVVTTSSCQSPSGKVPKSPNTGLAACCFDSRYSRDRCWWKGKWFYFRCWPPRRRRTHVSKPISTSQCRQRFSCGRKGGQNKGGVWKFSTPVSLVRRGHRQGMLCTSNW